MDVRHMTRSLSRGQDIILPPSALRALADAAATAMSGGEGVLLEAGREVGRALHPLVMQEGGASAQGDFWERLQMHLARRGLGSIRHRRIHPGIGLLESRGVAELAGEEAPGEGRPFAPFTTGLLRGLLSAAAGRPVDLRQLDGAPGGALCRWVFGSPAALDALERGMGRGRTLEEAVAEL
jgi:predicted hydrocarbon binding protein